MSLSPPPLSTLVEDDTRLYGKRLISVPWQQWFQNVYTNLVSGGTQTPTLTSINGGPLAGFRNRVINGNFGINQRGVSGTVTLAAGAYGHDRFKAGAGGCTYTFSTSANVTTITISAGSLIQVVEGLNLYTGTYCLSWSGTATGKIGAGSFSASGVTGSITGGTDTNIEFSTGTLSKVQLENGSAATSFENTRPYGTELALCQRYYEKSYAQGVAVPTNVAVLGWASIPGTSIATGNYIGQVLFKATKRATPTVTTYSFTSSTTGVCSNSAGTDFGASSCVIGSASDIGFVTQNTSGATITTTLNNFIYHWAASAEL